jgi:hypothetical protein
VIARPAALILALALLGGCSLGGALSFGSGTGGLSVGLHHGIAHSFTSRGSHVRVTLR